jgi:prepilin-type processing-associated H-X9-DG protein
LAAILFPVFARARENARRASCQSQLKQIGLGLMQYTQDYDEKFAFQGSPEIGNFATPAGPLGFTSWIGKSHPYIKSWQIFRCPSVQDATVAGAEPDGNSNNSYAASGMVVRRTGLSQAAIQEPATLVMVHEIPFGSRISYIRPYNGTNVEGANPSKYYDWLPEEPPYGTVDKVHFDEGGNLLFVDGHVKYRRVSGIRAAEFGLTNVVGGKDVGPNPPGNATSADPTF